MRAWMGDYKRFLRVRGARMGEAWARPAFSCTLSACYRQSRRGQVEENGFRTRKLVRTERSVLRHVSTAHNQLTQSWSHFADMDRRD